MKLDVYVFTFLKSYDYTSVDFMNYAKTHINSSLKPVMFLKFNPKKYKFDENTIKDLYEKNYVYIQKIVQKSVLLKESDFYFTALVFRGENGIKKIMI